ncbi:hypothetical protein FNH22_17295 [Fulvivirga sp. M361]|uniref:hypothetical protein n=1 Tax=Fulvivirga sp. M361 TaxID=2594266 RepID=UPI00117A9917|nr:hypothetical protein [Fulvivirga sp. M361]TRX56133.1 hypothetical protein FNH22_17295 [Fulvivirga sp. M361]
MNSKDQYLSEISEIKNMMERSSRFISLSGLSGVFAGVYALVGAWLVFDRMYTSDGMLYSRSYAHSYTSDVQFMLIVAGLVLFLALSTGIFFTTRKAKIQGLKIWDHTTKRLLINLLIPLGTGGMVCVILLNNGYYTMVAPSTLVFYGLSLINASHHTFKDIRYLGLTEIVIGLLAFVYVGYGLLFWAIGFGILHILYGTVMYFKYER